MVQRDVLDKRPAYTQSIKLITKSSARLKLGNGQGTPLHLIVVVVVVVVVVMAAFKCLHSIDQSQSSLPLSMVFLKRVCIRTFPNKQSLVTWQPYLKSWQDFGLS
jgi:hypothetical protein